MSAYEALLKKVNQIDDINRATAVLSWDREVNMPAAGTPERVAQMTTLSSLSHELFTSDEMGELIENASAEIDGADYDSTEASLLRLLERTYADSRKLTAEHVARSSEVGGHAHHAWVQARADNDFEAYRPWLEQVIELCQERAELYGFEDEAYDALLDKFEPDTKTAEVRAIFDALKTELVPLREAIDASSAEVDDSFLYRAYPIDQQKVVARELATALGYDFDRGHLGTVVHPFSTTFSRNDSRITTRWYENDLRPSLFGTMHESGHSMYEQGTSAEFSRTPLARGTSLGVHESQSRMMENVVGRSRGWWNTHFPMVQAAFPESLGDVSAEDFYRAINKVQPSFIRVEADELTYNFHIILRFELEQAMLNGELEARDVAAAWNAEMEELLGIVTPNDTEGCLQDVHWTRPMFGYFPTYALGNLYAAQWYEQAIVDDPNIVDEMAQGKTDALVAWLRTNIHQHGKKYTPRELVQRITGQSLSHEAFMRYAQAKFGDIYELS